MHPHPLRGTEQVRSELAIHFARGYDKRNDKS